MDLGEEDVEISMPALPWRDGMPLGQHVDRDLHNRRAMEAKGYDELAALHTFGPPAGGGGKRGGARTIARLPADDDSTGSWRPGKLKKPRAPGSVASSQEAYEPGSGMHPAAHKPILRPTRAQRDASLNESRESAIEASTPNALQRFNNPTSPASLFRSPNRMGSVQALTSMTTASSRSSLSFGASNDSEMREWAKEQRGRVTVEEHRILGEGGGEVKGLDKARAKIQRLVLVNYSQFARVFSKKDPSGTGQITRQEFEKALDELTLGLSKGEMTAVHESIRMVGVGMVDWEDFLLWAVGGNPLHLNRLKRGFDVHGHSRTANKKIGKIGLLKSPPSEAPTRTRFEVLPKLNELDTKQQIPIIVFFAGFICFPIWCIMWQWIRSKNPTTRAYARAGVVMSIVWSIVGIIVFLFIVISRDVMNDATTSPHCPNHMGAIVALRASGRDASRAAFWSGGDDFSKLTRFKVGVLQTVRLESRTLKDLGMEDRVLIDSIRDLDVPAGVAGRFAPTVEIRFRVQMQTLAEARKFEAIFVRWVQDDTLKDNLETASVSFDILSLAPIEAQDDWGTETSTPSIYEQMPTARVGGDYSPQNYWWEYSAPSLYRQPPTQGNVLDPEDPGWSVLHSNEKSVTCWSTALFTLGADACLEQANRDCTEVGAGSDMKGGGDRTIEVRLESNSTEIRLDLYLRQIYDGPDVSIAFMNAPSPIWMSDQLDGAIKGTSFRDLFRCKVPEDIGTCAYSATIKIGRGPAKSFYWIGVVGNSKDAENVPYTVKARYHNGGGLALKKQ